MATTIGRIKCLNIAAGYGFVNIQLETPTGINTPPVPPGPTNEILIIWFGNQSLVPKDLFTTELSKALSMGLKVSLFHDNDSAYITGMIVDAPFEGLLV